MVTVTMETFVFYKNHNDLYRGVMVHGGFDLVQKHLAAEFQGKRGAAVEWIEQSAQAGGCYYDKDSNLFESEDNHWDSFENNDHGDAVRSHLNLESVRAEYADAYLYLDEDGTFNYRKIR